MTTFASNKIVQDSGTLLSDLATASALTAGLALKVSKSGDSMSGNLNMALNSVVSVNTLSGSTNSRSVDNILSCTTLPTYGRLPMFAIANKVLEDSGISSFDIVTGPASTVDNNLASFNLTSGKIIKNSGILSSDVVLKSGTTMTGVLSQSNTTEATSSTGSIVTLGGISVAKKAFVSSNVVIGPSQTITYEGRLNLLGALNSTAGPHYNAYVSGVNGQFPTFQQLNYSHDFVATSYDAYWDGAWRSAL